MMAALVSAEEAEEEGPAEAAGELSAGEEEEKKDILSVWVRCASAREKVF